MVPGEDIPTNTNSASFNELQTETFISALANILRQLSPVISRTQILLYASLAAQSADPSKRFSYNKLSEIAKSIPQAMGMHWRLLPQFITYMLVGKNTLSTIAKNIDKIVQDPLMAEQVLESLKPLLKKLPQLVENINKELINWQLQEQDSYRVFLERAFMNFYKDNKKACNDSFEKILSIRRGPWALLGRIFPNNSIHKIALWLFLKGFVADENFKTILRNAALAIIRPQMPSMQSTSNRTSTADVRADAADFSLDSPILFSALRQMLVLFKPSVVSALKKSLTSENNLSKLQTKLLFAWTKQYPNFLTLGLTGIGNWINDKNNVAALIEMIAGQIDEDFIDKLLKKFNDPKDLSQAQHLIKNVLGDHIAGKLGADFHSGSYSTAQSTEILNKIMDGIEELLQDQMSAPSTGFLPLIKGAGIQLYMALLADKEKMRRVVTEVCDNLRETLHARLIPAKTVKYRISLEKFNMEFGKVLASNTLSTHKREYLNRLFEQMIAIAEDFKQTIASKICPLKKQLGCFDREKYLYDEQIADADPLEDLDEEADYDLNEMEKNFRMTAARLQNILTSLHRGSELKTEDFKTLVDLAFYRNLDAAENDLRIHSGYRSRLWSALKGSSPEWEAYQKQEALKEKIRAKIACCNEFTAIAEELRCQQKLYSELDGLTSNKDKIKDALMNGDLNNLQRLHSMMSEHEMALKKYSHGKKIYGENKYGYFASFKAWLRGCEKKDISAFEIQKQNYSNELCDLLKKTRKSSMQIMMTKLISAEPRESVLPSQENFKAVIAKIADIKTFLNNKHAIYKIRKSDLQKLCDQIERDINTLPSNRLP